MHVSEAGKDSPSSALQRHSEHSKESTIFLFKKNIKIFKFSA
jgi:hypothetical protein